MMAERTIAITKVRCRGAERPHLIIPVEATVTAHLENDQVVRTVGCPHAFSDKGQILCGVNNVRVSYLPFCVHIRNKAA